MNPNPSAPLCAKCKTRPRWVFGSGKTYAYCYECHRQKGQEYAYGSLHRMADQYRPQKAEETKTADPQARRQLRKKELD